MSLEVHLKHASTRRLIFQSPEDALKDLDAMAVQIRMADGEPFLSQVLWEDAESAYWSYKEEEHDTPEIEAKMEGIVLGLAQALAHLLKREVRSVLDEIKERVGNG